MRQATRSVLYRLGCARMSAGRLPAEGVVLGMHHVQLSYPAQHQALVESFYGQLLGLPRVVHTQTQRHVLSYLAGSQRIDLVPRMAAHPSCECLGHLALQVAGVQALQQRLLDHGATALAVVRVDEGLRFYAKDPAGNTLELLQPEAHLIERGRRAEVQPAAAQPVPHEAVMA